MNPFDEFPLSDRPDACRWETGHPSSLLLDMYNVYSVDIFDDADPPLTNLQANGVATMHHLHFYLIYKYIHVSAFMLLRVVALSLKHEERKVMALRCLYRCTRRNEHLKLPCS